jgi:hypothetical protein
MNICTSLYEINVKRLAAAAATDEVLVGRQVRGSPRLRGAVGATFEHSIQGGLSDHEKPRRRRRRDSGYMDESLCSFDNFRW